MVTQSKLSRFSTGTIHFIGEGKCLNALKYTEWHSRKYVF